jgi:hypothetical protein
VETQYLFCHFPLLFDVLCDKSVCEDAALVSIALTAYISDHLISTVGTHVTVSNNGFCYTLLRVYQYVTIKY